MSQSLSFTTGTIDNTLRAVRCAHRPCLDSGRGMMLCELSPAHQPVVVALPRRMDGYDLVKKCEHCAGWNGVNFGQRQQAA